MIDEDAAMKLGHSEGLAAVHQDHHQKYHPRVTEREWTVLNIGPVVRRSITNGMRKPVAAAIRDHSQVVVTTGA